MQHATSINYTYPLTSKYVKIHQNGHHCACDIRNSYEEIALPLEYLRLETRVRTWISSIFTDQQTIMMQIFSVAFVCFFSRINELCKMQNWLRKRLFACESNNIGFYPIDQLSIKMYDAKTHISKYFQIPCQLQKNFEIENKMKNIILDTIISFSGWTIPFFILFATAFRFLFPLFDNKETITRMSLFFSELLYK